MIWGPKLLFDTETIDCPLSSSSSRVVFLNFHACSAFYCLLDPFRPVSLSPLFPLSQSSMMASISTRVADSTPLSLAVVRKSTPSCACSHSILISATKEAPSIIFSTDVAASDKVHTTCGVILSQQFQPYPLTFTATSSMIRDFSIRTA